MYSDHQTRGDCTRVVIDTIRGIITFVILFTYTSFFI